MNYNDPAVIVLSQAILWIAVIVVPAILVTVFLIVQDIPDRIRAWNQERAWRKAERAYWRTAPVEKWNW